MTPREQWVELWRSFPVLRHAMTPAGEPIPPAVENMHLLDAWAASPMVEEAERQAAAFVLTVWSNHEPWRCGRFDLMTAMTTWDVWQRMAFQAWVLDPFRP